MGNIFRLIFEMFEIFLEGKVKKLRAPAIIISATKSLISIRKLVHFVIIQNCKFEISLGNWTDELWKVTFDNSVNRKKRRRGWTKLQKLLCSLSFLILFIFSWKRWKMKFQNCFWPRLKWVEKPQKLTWEIGKLRYLRWIIDRNNGCVFILFLLVFWNGDYLFCSILYFVPNLFVSRSSS